MALQFELTSLGRALTGELKGSYGFVYANFWRTESTAAKLVLCDYEICVRTVRKNNKLQAGLLQKSLRKMLWFASVYIMLYDFRRRLRCNEEGV
jgi:hypothetical protein